MCVKQISNVKQLAHQQRRRSVSTEQRRGSVSFGLWLTFHMAYYRSSGSGSKKSSALREQIRAGGGGGNFGSRGYAPAPQQGSMSPILAQRSSGVRPSSAPILAGSQSRMQRATMGSVSADNAFGGMSTGALGPGGGGLGGGGKGNRALVRRSAMNVGGPGLEGGGGGPGPSGAQQARPMSSQMQRSNFDPSGDSRALARAYHAGNGRKSGGGGGDVAPQSGIGAAVAGGGNPLQQADNHQQQGRQSGVIPAAQGTGGTGGVRVNPQMRPRSSGQVNAAAHMVCPANHGLLWRPRPDS